MKLLLNEPGHGQGRVWAHARVVIHVQHPHVVQVLVLAYPQLMRVVTRARLKPGSVGSAILRRHGDKPYQLASGGEPGDPVCCLAALVDHYVDPEPGKTCGEIGDIGQDRTFERGVGVVSADGRNDDDQEILASRKPKTRPARP